MSDDKTPTSDDPMQFVFKMLLEQTTWINAIRMALQTHTPQLYESVLEFRAQLGAPAPAETEPSLDHRLAEFLKGYEGPKQ